MKIHQLKINFNITEAIERFVYVYVIESKYLYLIDSGVYGSENDIISFIEAIGRKTEEIKGIFLTHAHPDHIGTVAYFRENTGCKVYAGRGEKAWIEDIDLQFKERPIPNFYNLAGRSSTVDIVVKDGDVLYMEEGLVIQVVGTPGHSADEVSYRIADNLFIGDAVPVKDDIPIYIDKADALMSLNVLENMQGINYFYPAWDKTYTKDEMTVRLDEARQIIKEIDDSISKAGESKDLDALVDSVYLELNMPVLKTNPLFRRTVASHIKA